MSVKKKITLTAIIAAVSVLASGCGKAMILENKASDIECNGNIISGAAFSKTEIKPAESIPDQTGSHQTTVVTSTTKAAASQQTKPETVQTTASSSETSYKENSYDEPSEETIYSIPDSTKPPVSIVETKTEPPATALQTTESTSQKPMPEPDSDSVPSSTDSLPVNSYTALNYSEVKGVWIWYSELYPILTGKSESQLRSGIGEYYDNCLSLGINTVYVHVRPFGDAIYKSDYFPWSKYCTGYIGEDPGYDPLNIMI